MAIEWDIYLGTTGPTGKLSPFGRRVSIKTQEKVREARAANGTLHRDILFTKKVFSIAYSNITESALDVLDYWYDYYVTNKTALSLYMYTGPAAYDEYTVIPKPVDRTRVVKATDNLFSGVVFELVEV